MTATPDGNPFNDFPDFGNTNRQPGTTADGLPSIATNVEVRKTGKIRELGIFTVGVGIIVAALTLYITFIIGPGPGVAVSPIALVLPLSMSVVYIVLGILTQRSANPTIIQVTMALVTLGFVFDLVVGFHIIKAVITGAVIGLIIKTGLEALKELEPPAK